MQVISSIQTTTLTLRELENDPQFKIWVQSIAKEALLKPNPGIEVFSFDKNRFTIVNHTDQRISFSENRLLTINKVAIDFFVDDCQIIAYHPEDHPEIICFEQKDIAKTKPKPRYFAELVWKETYSNNTYSERYCTVSKGLGLELKLNPLGSKKTFPALNIQLPDDIEDSIKKNLMLIMEGISPAANLCEKPNLIEKTFNGVTVRILNFTSHDLNFNAFFNEFIIDNQQILSKKTVFLSSNSCCIIAYHVDKYPDTICLDVKDDDKINLKDRIFLIKDESLWSLIQAHQCENPLELTNLLASQTKNPQDPGLYIQSNNDIQELMEYISLQYISPKAILKDNPQVSCYLGRLKKTKYVASACFTIVNHTNHDIYFDINNRLYIDNSIVTKFDCEPNTVCHMVAYHLQDQPQRILLERLGRWGHRAKIENTTYNLSWNCCPTSKKCEAILEELRKRGVFKQLWLAKREENSPFYKTHFPEEITNQIFHFYALLN